MSDSGAPDLDANDNLLALKTLESSSVRQLPVPLLGEEETENRNTLEEVIVRKDAIIPKQSDILVRPISEQVTCIKKETCPSFHAKRKRDEEPYSQTNLKRHCCSFAIDTPDEFKIFNPCIQDTPLPTFEHKGSFHWICFDRQYKMSPSFEKKEFCAEFTSKILVFKSIQFLIVASWTLAAKASDTLVDLIEDYFWTFFIALSTFVTIYLAARLTNVIKSIPLAACCFVLSTVSLAHICASIFIHWATYTVPIILLTLVFSYIVVCIFCLGFTKVDVKRQDIFVPIVASTLIYSLISYAAIMLVHDASGVVYEFGKIWLPSMMISLVVATGEMQEIQKLLHGLRLPLNDNEWIIASNYVL